MSSRTVKAGRWFRTKVQDALSQTQAEAIADVTVTGTYATDDDALETAINSMLAVLRANGMVAE